MTLSASIVLFKQPPHILRRLLECIMDSPIEKVWIIDHSPTDRLRTEVPVKPGFIYWRHPNRGYGAGNNEAIKASIAEGFKYHIVMNPDVYWEPGTIETMLDFMQHNGDVVHVMPKVLYPDGSFQLQAKMLPTACDLFFGRFGYNSRNREQWKKHVMNLSQPVDVEFLSGCFMLLRNAALEKGGAFDERFFMYCEDMDLTRRMGRIGRTVYFPGATIHHHLNRESARSFKLLGHHLASAVRYLRKYRNGPRFEQFNKL